MRIALVGGGLTAASVIESLLHIREERFAHKDCRLEVTVFDASPYLWLGQAFRPDCPEALSNLHISAMSLRPWDPDHGTRWMRHNGYDEFTVPGSYAPREVVGGYFKAAMADATKQLDNFELVREYVEKVVPGELGVQIRTRQGEQMFDAAVLCVGGSTSGQDPYGLTGAPGFIKNPYPLRENLADITPDERVGVLGAGLTAVDIVARLIAQGHKGPITLMSRRGLLPAVRPPTTSTYQPKYFTVNEVEHLRRVKGKVTLADLEQMTMKDLEEAGADKEWLIKEMQFKDRGIVRLRRHLKDGDNDAYQVLLKQMWKSHEVAWYFLDDEEKRYVRTTFRALIASLCCPIPHHRAQQLLRLADSGQLEVHEGLDTITASVDNDGFDATTKEEKMHLDRIISAVTDANSPPETAASMISGLLASGAAREHTLGGFDVEHATCRLVNKEGQPQRRLYAMGALLSGAFQIYNGIPLYAPHTLRIADAILGG